MSAARVLDQVWSLDAIARLEADPGQYAQELARELSPATTLVELEARDAELVRALDRIDELAIRVMTIRLEHALASETSIGPPTRKVFATTIVGYAANLGLLGERARDVAQRGRAAEPDRVAETVMAAGRATLAVRDAVRTPVLELIRALAAAAVPEADRKARTRTLDEPMRKRWSAARRDLEAIVEVPERVRIAPMAARLAGLAEQLDEPVAEREVTFADMIELD